MKCVKHLQDKFVCCKNMLNFVYVNVLLCCKDKMKGLLLKRFAGSFCLPKYTPFLLKKCNIFDMV